MCFPLTRGMTNAFIKAFYTSSIPLSQDDELQWWMEESCDVLEDGNCFRIFAVYPAMRDCLSPVMQTKPR